MKTSGSQSNPSQQRSAPVNTSFTAPVSTGAGAEEVDSRDLSCFTEAAHGAMGEELAIVSTAAGDKRLIRFADMKSGHTLLLRVFTSPEVPKRMKPAAITFEPTDSGPKVNVAKDFDACFWSESAVEKFLFPYYEAHRLLTRQEMEQLRTRYKSENAIAILHMPPSRSLVAETDGSIGVTADPAESYQVLTVGPQMADSKEPIVEQQTLREFLISQRAD